MGPGDAAHEVGQVVDDRSESVPVPGAVAVAPLVECQTAQRKPPLKLADHRVPHVPVLTARVEEHHRRCGIVDRAAEGGVAAVELEGSFVVRQHDRLLSNLGHSR